MTDLPSPSEIGAVLDRVIPVDQPAFDMMFRQKQWHLPQSPYFQN